MSKIRVTKVKSSINRPYTQGRTLEALGLTKINSFNELEATPQILGMVRKVNHLIKVENID
ncbi:MAG: 50S ribosomal protein L30 [Bacteroidia bacterium]|nr:50S ribosomal protein L30 [Bacteroidia bacterium]